MHMVTHLNVVQRLSMRWWPGPGWIVALAMTVAHGLCAAAQTLTVAQIGPLVGPAASDTRDLSAGIQAHLAEVNARGGVSGQQLSYFLLDDRYEAAEFERQFEAAMQRRPVAVLAPLGLNALRTLLGARLLDRHDTVVINAVPGATSFRTPGHARLFHLRASDRQQIEKILRHALTLGVTRLHVITQDLAAATADVQGASRSVPGSEALHLQLSAVPMQADALLAAGAAARAAGAQAVLVMGAPPYMAQAVASLRQAGVSSMLFALSYLPTGLVVKLAGPEAARGVGIAQAFPNPMGHTLPLHRQFHAAMKSYAPTLKAYSSFHLEGYLTARVLTEALRRTPAPQTPSALAGALGTMGPLDLGGFRVNFDASRAGSSFVDIAVISANGRLTY